MTSRYLWILPALALTSCAFSDLNVKAPRLGSTGLSGGIHRKVHVILPFLDERPNRSRCGMQKNGYNMDTADVNCVGLPSQWVADALATELRTAGFDVTTGPASNSNGVKLEGQLLQFFIEPKVGAFTVTPEADIHVRLVASSASGLLAEREFYVKGTRSALVGVESTFQAASDRAFQDIMKSMVSAVISLMDNYPSVGTEQAAIPSA